MRRIGVLQTLAENDPESTARHAALEQALQTMGWSKGRNLRIEYRWADANNISTYAAELVALAPDVILANANPSVLALQQATRSVPIVFVAVTDPVGAMFVESLAHPGSNVTGFSVAEYGMSAKWLELLKEIAPSITQVAVLQDPQNLSSLPQFAAIQSVAPLLRVDLKSLALGDVNEIERAVATFARGSNLGLIATRTAAANRHRHLIIRFSQWTNRSGLSFVLGAQRKPRACRGLR